ncbi:protein of unassigned function [Methylobacterium oryzae CBMB20]|uniref:Protein of unassigned function n=1 Tax=Methylobacterium oryzae CBMB20 TaxID=693986 RepID=A0A089NQQ1_9HYPH|nr:protein of unassigned function [Methylobacterium oryzae CBMB20]
MDRRDSTESADRMACRRPRFFRRLRAVSDGVERSIPAG